MATQKEKIEAALRIAVDQVAKDGSVSELTPADAQVVKEELIRKAEPFLRNLTNSESLWQSKVLIGNIAAILAAGAGIVTLAQTPPVDFNAIAALVGAIAMNGLSIYGRLSTSKPIGQ